VISPVVRRQAATKRHNVVGDGPGAVVVPGKSWRAQLARSTSADASSPALFIKTVAWGSASGDIHRGCVVPGES
jgi:hypothetical protein